MKTALRIVAPLAAALALAPVAARADVKLGFVDLQRALNEVDEGKAAKAQLKKDFDVKQKTLDERQDELKKLKVDFDKQSVVMAEPAKRDRQAELDRKFMETQQLYVQMQKELSEREREVTKGIFDRMAKIIGEIAEAEGFTMIFDRENSGLIYAPVSLDVTNELIRKFNARGPAGKKPEAAKPAPAVKPAPAAKK
jgi:outer membrane protein